MNRAYYIVTTPHGDCLACLKDSDDARSLAQGAADQRGHKMWIELDGARVEAFAPSQVSS